MQWGETVKYEVLLRVCRGEISWDHRREGFLGENEDVYECGQVSFSIMDIDRILIFVFIQSSSFFSSEGSR